MEKDTKKTSSGPSTLAKLAASVSLVRPSSLGELIHAAVRTAIEQAVEDELEVAVGAPWYERGGERRGYRNGSRERTLTGPTGPVNLTLPRGSLFEPRTTDASREWRSALVPRYQRRMSEVNEAVLATYLAGGNTRQLKGALRPLLKNVPLGCRSCADMIGGGFVKIDRAADDTVSSAG